MKENAIEKNKVENDFQNLTDEKLLQLQQNMLGELSDIENPSFAKRLWNRVLKLGAAAAAFTASFWLSDNTYLRPQQRKIEESASIKAEEPRSNYMKVALDLDKEPAKGERLVWSCANCTCPKGMGGQCFPVLIKADHPEAPKYKDVTLDHIATFKEANPHHPEQIKARFLQDGESYKNPDIAGVRQLAGLSEPSKVTLSGNSTGQKEAINALKQQTVFASVTSTGIAIGAFAAVKELIDSPAQKQAENLRWNLQDIEDELLSRRGRMAA